MNTTASAGEVLRLHLVAPIATAPVVCDDTYTCPCEPCIALRLDLVVRGVRPLVRQPYEPIPIGRRQAAA
jgi:hypothetical protein